MLSDVREQNRKWKKVRRVTVLHDEDILLGFYFVRYHFHAILYVDGGGKILKKIERVPGQYTTPYSFGPG